MYPSEKATSTRSPFCLRKSRKQSEVVTPQDSKKFRAPQLKKFICSITKNLFGCWFFFILTRQKVSSRYFPTDFPEVERNNIEFFRADFPIFNKYCCINDNLIKRTISAVLARKFLRNKYCKLSSMIPRFGEKT